MKNLTAMTFAIMTAFAFSGPAVFTATTANAADLYCFSAMNIESEKEKYC
ncbi:MAG: hypothetical protein V6Z81_11300 [Parvularculales bacterium]